MNKRRFSLKFGALPCVSVSSFAVCALAFTAGVVAGTALSADFAVGDGGAGFLAEYISALGDGAVFSVWQTLVKLGWYHLLTFLLGFTALGVLLVPAVAAVRGFTIAFTLAALVRLYSFGGAAVGAVLLGIPALFSVPLLFPLAMEAMCMSLELARTGLMGAPPSGTEVVSAYLVRFAGTAIALLLISLGERLMLTSGLLELPIFP